MTRTAATTPDAGPGAPARPGGGLYAPPGWAVVRAPLLELGAGAGDGVRADLGGGSLLPGDPRVRAALGVASPDLVAALARTRPGHPSAARLRGKLLRYRLRMSARPTPYALFAGVGLAGWGDRTDLAIGAGPARTRTRPDMGWLLDLVVTRERDPAVRAELRLVADASVVAAGGRVFRRDGGSLVSVRATAAVRQVLALARTPVPYRALADRLGGTPGATPEKVARLLDELWRQGFLHSDLRPPLTGGADPSAHVRERLAAIPAAAPAAAGMAALVAALRAWDGLALEDRAGAWPGLLDQVRALHPAGDAADVLQTDMALPLAGTRVSAAVGREAARAAELLLKLGAHPHGPPHLDAYRDAFVARYGPDRQIPLLELLDPDFGLGPPSGHDHPPFPRRERTLCTLALEAIRDRRLAVELDDELLERLATCAPRAATAPPSLDLSVFVAATSPAAVDAGDFQMVVGPNVGSSPAGSALGRFADLLGAGALAALAGVAAAEQAAAPGAVLAEVVYLPSRARLANVAIRPGTRTREIVLGTRPGVPEGQVVPLDELVVGVRAGRFTVTWPAGGGAPVVAVQAHMLNSRSAPVAARFLLDVAGHGRSQLLPFDWGPAGAFPFLPRVRRGRVVLSLARWRIDPAAGDLPLAPPARFAGALAAWRARWSVPRHAYLAVADNRLLLDLDDPDHAELLRDELRRLPHGQPALLQEALPGPEHAWLPGPGGGHLAEFTVPLLARQPDAPATGVAADPRASAAAGPVPAAARLRPPGSDWLYLKLYCPPPFHDELIAGPVRGLAEFATNAGLADGWFFVRYADPDPHLRLRFHGTPGVLLGQLLRHACVWAADLVADGRCATFAVDTYQREVERYGGERGVAAAEGVFMADSRAAAEILRLDEAGELGTDLATAAVLTADDLLGALGLDAAERLEVCRHGGPRSRRGGQEYRQRQRELRELLGGAPARAGPPGRQGLARILTARRAALAPAAAWLTAAGTGGPPRIRRAELGRILVHLHLNRLLGTDPHAEQLALELLHRTRDGLRAAADAEPEVRPGHLAV
jgi:thiopeptide-type bacteriocin biosynthesis protein